MRLTEWVGDAAHSVRVVARSGLLHPTRPERIVRVASAFRHWGPSIGGVYAVSAARYGDRVAVFDERGPATFTQLDESTDALARAFMAHDIGAGDVVGVLARNSRAFVEAVG